MALATMAAIYGALGTILGAVSGVDQTSTTDYLPSIKTVNTALVITPFGKESAYGISSLADTSASWQTHVIRCEFWTKHDGVNSTTMTRAWAIGSAAVAALLANSTLGGVITTVGLYDGEQYDFTVRAVTDEEMLVVNSIPYVRTVVMAPVTDFA